jgi:hypothetical protein
MHKLMTLSQADRILEDFEIACISYDECAAEAGMGAVSMGFDGYNGVAEFRMFNRPPAPDAEVIEAREVAAMFYGLRLYSADDLFPSWVSTIPEFMAPSDTIPF